MVFYLYKTGQHTIHKTVEFDIAIQVSKNDEFGKVIILAYNIFCVKRKIS